MPGVIAQYGAAKTLNRLCGNDVPWVAGSPPGVNQWYPGLYFVNTATYNGHPANSVFESFDGGNTWHLIASGINPVAAPRYCALMYADPVANHVVYITDPGWAEISDTGYVRQLCLFNLIGGGSGYTNNPPSVPISYPASTTNYQTLTFGPFTGNNPTGSAQTAGWLVMIAMMNATDTDGLPLFSWQLDTVQQVVAGETIVISAGAITLTDQ